MSSILFSKDLILKCQNGEEIGSELLKEVNLNLKKMVVEVVSKHRQSFINKSSGDCFVMVSGSGDSVCSPKEMAEKLREGFLNRIMLEPNISVESFDSLSPYLTMKLAIRRCKSTEVSQVCLDVFALPLPEERG